MSWKPVVLTGDPPVIGGLYGNPNVTQDERSLTDEHWVFQNNPYYRTLRYPATYTGVRIPDNCGSDTMTFTCVKRQNKVCSTNVTDPPIAGYKVFPVLIGQGFYGNVLQSSIIPNNTLATYGASPGRYQIGYFGANLNATTDVFGPNAVPIQLDDWNSDTSRVLSLCSAVRLVSAGISVKVCGTQSATTIFGEITAAFLPRNFVSSNSGFMSLNNISTTGVKQLPGSVVVPLLPNASTSVVYVPVDEACNTFVDPSVAASSLSSYEQSLYDPGAFLVVAEGLSLTTGVEFEVVIWLNYEAIPKANTLVFTNASSSVVSDPIAVSEALNLGRTFGGAAIGNTGFDGVGWDNTLSHPLAKQLFGMRYLDRDCTDGMLIHTQLADNGPPQSDSTGCEEEDEDGGSGFVSDQTNSMFSLLLEEISRALSQLTKVA